MTDLASWEAFSGVSNYSRIEHALDKLARRRRYVEFRSRIPMLDGSVCVGYVDDLRAQASWDQTAKIYALGANGEVTVGVTDIRRDRDFQRMGTGLIRFYDREEFRGDVPTNLDGFISTIQSDGAQQLAGLAGDNQVELPGVTQRDADAFAVACLLAIENRSRT